MPANKPPFDGEWVRLNQLCMKGRSALRQKDLIDDGPYAVYGASGIIGSMSTFQNGARYVAVVKDGAGVGRANLCSARTSVLGTMQALIPTEMVLPEYLLHLIRAMRLGDGFSGSTIPHIYFKDYGQRLVRYVSMADQERIVGMLGSIEDQIDILHQQNERFDTLVKSRFVEMFRDPVSNEMGWPASTIKETAIIYGDGPFGSNLKSSDYVDEGARVIRLGNIQQGYFSEKDQSFVSYEKYEQLNRYKCSPGEIVIATLGSPILRACLVPDSCDPSIHKADCMYYEVDRDRLVPTFAMCVINHPSMLRRAAADVHGQTRGRINSTQTGALPMILPPLALQQEFASFVAEVDKSRYIVQQKIEKLQTLYDSLAQEYFG